MTSAQQTAYQEALARACYRAILKREPEAQVTSQHLAPPIESGIETLIEETISDFLASAEYRDLRLHERDVIGSSGVPLTPTDLISEPRAAVEAKIRQRCLVAFLGDHTALCRVLGRYNVFVDTRDVGFATHLMMDGRWELGLTEFMVRTIKSGWRVVDVGANFGYYSLLMSDLVGPRGHCLAFEPNPRAAELTRRSLAVNGFGSRSRLLQVALSAQSQDATQFYVPDAEPKNARIFEGELPSYLAAEGRLISVPTRAFSDMADDIEVIDFIKIDTEGAEYGILSGMLDYALAHRPRIIAEVNFARGYDAAALLTRYLAVYGRLRVLDEQGVLAEVTVDEMKSRQTEEDWLVYLGDD
jgi:FkbM family methyltransferase